MSDRGGAAAGVAQDVNPSQQPTQPIISWEAEQAHGVHAASGPQKDTVATLVAELAALAASVSPSSTFLVHSTSATHPQSSYFRPHDLMPQFASPCTLKFASTDSGSGTLSSRERLQLLSCLFYILGWGCASLRQVLTQALQAWLASEPVPAATPNHPGMDEQMLMLGVWLINMNSETNLKWVGCVHVSCSCYYHCARCWRC